MSLTDSVTDLLSIRKTAEGYKVAGEDAIDVAKLYLESSAGAAATSFVNGRYPGAVGDHAELFGAPVDLGVFVAANVAIVLGLAGRNAKDLANFGVGGLNTYVSRLFTKMGSQSRIKAISGGATPGQIASGGFMGGAPIGAVTQVGGGFMGGAPGLAHATQVGGFRMG